MFLTQCLKTETLAEERWNSPWPAMAEMLDSVLFRNSASVVMLTNWHCHLPTMSGCHIAPARITRSNKPHFVQLLLLFLH